MNIRNHLFGVYLIIIALGDRAACNLADVNDEKLDVEFLRFCDRAKIGTLSSFLHSCVNPIN